MFHLFKIKVLVFDFSLCTKMEMTRAGPSQQEEEEEHVYEDAYSVVNKTETTSPDTKTAATISKLYRMCVALVCFNLLLMCTSAVSGGYLLKKMWSQDNVTVSELVNRGSYSCLACPRKNEPRSTV